MMENLIAKAEVLLEALPYIQQFHDAMVLVKFGGSAMEDPEVTKRVLKDIAFMQSAGMRPIIVHGGGALWNGEEITMGIEDVLAVCKAASGAKIIAVAA